MLANEAFDFSHWENDDDLIIYFIPTIEDENELNIFFDRTVSSTAYWTL
jgi:hypothetical protein